MRPPPFVISILAATALVAGCGSDSSSEKSAAAGSTTALAELGNVRAALDEARKTFDDGDFKQASIQVGDAYLNHYENVEKPLSQVDNALMLKIEKEIRETLRGEVSAGTPQPEVHKLFDQVSADLDTAEAKLK
ncbi:MAG: hypothetical protein QOF76_4255 [Solirubrobacteraceae bacterium]|jgi:hypothetical protein|nr:hypothetical protein [Solirubrobacteraceae bacterium]